MKKILLLITLLCLLCASACNLGGETVTTDTDATSDVTTTESSESTTSTEATTETVQTAGLVKIRESYEYEEGTYNQRERYEQELLAERADNSTVNGNSVPDKETAIAIACDEMEERLSRYSQSIPQEMIAVLFETEDDVWIVSFVPDREFCLSEYGHLIVGGGYDIAISKTTGNVLKVMGQE